MDIERPRPIVLAALVDLIYDTIKLYGPKCDLNFIDTSQITNMAYLFSQGHLRCFNGDISKWDVTAVTRMEGMFEYSEFNGDISNWNVENVSNMRRMFYYSEFAGNIDNWNPNCNTKYMFHKCSIIYQEKLPIWYKD